MYVVGMVTNESRYIDAQRARYLGKVTEIATRLRDMADRIERDGSDVDREHFGREGQRFSACAYAVHHEIVWTIANLGVDHLSALAAEIDVALAREPVE